MKKTSILLIVLAVVACITYIVVSKKSTINEGANISIQDTAAVQKLLLVDMQGNKAVLKRNANRWILNDSIIGREDAVKTILEILYKIQAAQPVPASAHNNVVNQLSTKGVKVEAYNKNNEVLTSFTIGGTTVDAKGNYAFKKGTERPYIYQKKGFIGDLSTAFFTSPAEWRNRQIYFYNPDSIAKVSVYYSDFMDSSFHILNENNQLEATYDNGTSMTCSHTKVKEYLKEFANKYCLNFENQMAKADSIKYKGYPYGLIAVQTKSGVKDTLRLVRFKADQRANETKEINGVLYDQSVLFGYTRKDLLVIKTDNFSKILSIPSFFRQ